MLFGKAPWHPVHDPCHYLQDLFNRRLAKGQCAYVPHLGLSQFKATYFGPFRPETKKEPLNLVIHHFLVSMYDSTVLITGKRLDARHKT